jgi:aryl-alcohol dehydrogenase-like predicted oxidoreductase
VPAAEATRILECAAAAGLRDLDTAPIYDGSEAFLGQWLQGRPGFQIITKTARLGSSHATKEAVADVVETFHRSLKQLGQSSVHAFLVHDPADLFATDADRLWAAMAELKDAGHVAKIGVSLHSTADLECILEKYPLDVVQVPVNVLDQRFVTTGLLDRIQAQGIEVHARSIFLQGLLLMSLDKVPPYFLPWKKQLAAWQEWIQERGWSPLQGAVYFLRQCTGIDSTVFGVCSEAQLRQILAAFAESVKSVDFALFALHEEAVINPDYWHR